MLQISLAGQNTSQPLPSIDNLSSNLSGKTTGKWEVKDGSLILDGSDNLGAFTVNDKGLFFINAVPASSLGVPGLTGGFASVIAFKK